MMPDNSLPGLAGNGGIQEYRPSRIKISGRLTPIARERITTSPGPGTGIGPSTISSTFGPPGCLSTTVFIRDDAPA